LENDGEAEKRGKQQEHISALIWCP